MKNWLTFSVVGIIITILSACSNPDSTNHEKIGNGETITISGSTSVGPLVEKLAMHYEKKVNVNIEVNQIGSSAGIANTINDVSQIGMSSRDVKQDEKARGIEEKVIAYDGIVVIAHSSNRVKDLTMAQVKQIFTGEITNWKDLGGEDLEIVVVSREDGSGSRDAFQEIIGYKSGELIRNAIVASGNGNIKTTVAMNKHAIGFISFEYIDDSISTMNINHVEPTAENVLNGSYLLSRPFLFVHKSEVPTAVQAFMDYLTTQEAQKIIQQAGAIPLVK